MILGDPAYPLLSWLIKGYPENIDTPCIQRRLNYHLSRAHMSVENTFGHWKGRFRRLTKHIDMDVEGVIKIASASCVIHKICEMQNEPCFEEWLQQSLDNYNNRRLRVSANEWL